MEQNGFGLFQHANSLETLRSTESAADVPPSEALALGHYIRALTINIKIQSLF